MYSSRYTALYFYNSFIVSFIFPHLLFFCAFEIGSHITQADVKFAIGTEDNLKLLILLPSYSKYM